MTNFQIQSEALSEIKKTTTWLQGIGAAFGKPAGELQPGDVVAWNYGSTSTVSTIVKETTSTITVEFAADAKCKAHQRTFKKSRIVALSLNGRIYASRVTKDMIS